MIHATKPPKARRPLQPLLVDIRGAGELLGVSPRHLHTLVDAGLAPTPIKLGGSCRWSVASLSAWCANGCPAMQSNSQVGET